MKNHSNRVLVAPLDWGLGHATRCIPVIRELLNQNAEVVICASGGGRTILVNTFPQCRFIIIPGINIRYPADGTMATSMVKQAASIFAAIRTEHDVLNRLIDQVNITHVISDNRYGLYNRKVKSVFISHQVRIKSSRALKFLEPLLYRMNRSRIEKFDELWIPDNPPPDNLSGTLSSGLNLNIPTRHLGILTRFTTKVSASEKNYDFIALLSGPEPQRTLFEKKVFDIFTASGKKCLMVLGVPDKGIPAVHRNVTCLPGISNEELQQVLHPETTLICRPGYSTLMDLTVLAHRKIVFIPTPGQTEQEYLANEMNLKYGYSWQPQSGELLLNNVMPGMPLPASGNHEALSTVIRKFLE